MRTNKNWKINLLNFHEKSILTLLNLLKENKFHAKQIINSIYKKNVFNINLINIKNTLKNKLINITQILPLKIKKEYIDTDNTIKWLIETNTDNLIETVAIPNSKNHFTICISSQIGCILNCYFCATGRSGFKRNLKTHEIISQLIIAKIKIKNLFPEKNITNIVMMGMGEPLLNLENVISFISIASNKNCLDISKKKITLSTSGIIPNIEILNKYKIPLALSLHATNDALRSKLMPINKKYKIKNLLNECKKYSMKNDLTIEYIMLKDINDSKDHAIKLTKLLKNIKCKICLIPFNKIKNIDFSPTSMENIKIFQNILKNKGITTNIRKRKGFNINAACGQLAGSFKSKKITEYKVKF